MTFWVSNYKIQAATLALFLLFHTISFARSVELMVGGLFVNQKEIDQLVDVIKVNDSIYFPHDLLSNTLKIKPKETKTSWEYETPMGVGKIKKSDIYQYQSTNYLPALSTKALGITAKYNKPLSALQLFIPWEVDSKQDEQPTSHTKKKKNNIDYYPESFGLGGINISGGVNRQVNKTKNISTNNMGSRQKEQEKHYLDTFYTRLGLTGHLFGGLWGADIQYNELKFHSNSKRHSDSHKNFSNQHPFTLNNIYWSKSWDNWAMRLGTNNSSYGLGLEGYTGATFAYSNQGIKPHLFHINSSTSQLLANNGYSSNRNIKGIGPAGGIAELRVNGNAIARVRIGLDKKYEFTGFNLNNYGSNGSNIEVAIFEYSLSESPIQVYKPSLYPRHSNVGTQELLIEGGLGRKGNLFNDNDDRKQDSSTVAHAYAEYGLTNNIAIRAAIAHNKKSQKTDNKYNGSDYEHMFGINFGLPFEINLDLSYQSLGSQNIFRSYLYYHYDSKYIDVNYNYLHTNYENKKHYEIGDSINRQNEQYLNILLKPHERFNLGLYGTHKVVNKEISGTRTEQYFTANLNARLYDNLNLNIHKDRYNDYRYELNWYIPKWRTNVYGSWDTDNRKISISKTLTDSLDVGASITQRDDVNAYAYHGYIDYQYNDKHKFHFGINHFNQQKGFDINWQYRLNDYGLINLGYRTNQSSYERNIKSDNSIFNDEDYFYLQFNFDFVKKERGGLDFGHYQPSYYGSVVTNINLEDSNNITLDDRIQIKLDGYTVDAYQVADKQYRIDNIKPGVYELEFPTDNLPLEYQSKALKKPTIKVAEAAPTVIDYQLQKTYGVSGQLLNEKEGVLINIYHHNKKFTETRTQAYGYYQVLGLPKGKYILKTKGHADKVVTINDTFLFEVNL